jgi:peptidoglycan LD-endopeptidase CwlK
MSPRDHERLIGVHPVLIGAILSVLDEMDADGHPMFVVEGVRTHARQAELYAQGRTTPGPIVTYKDGVTHKSNHQPREGFGWAVDCAFLGPQPFDLRHPWGTYGEALEVRGIVWGGRWKMADKPHAEYQPTWLLKA